jgi:hypothetical protein
MLVLHRILLGMGSSAVNPGKALDSYKAVYTDSYLDCGGFTESHLKWLALTIYSTVYNFIVICIQLLNCRLIISWEANVFEFTQVMPNLS